MSYVRDYVKVFIAWGSACALTVRAIAEGFILSYEVSTAVGLVESSFLIGYALGGFLWPIINAVAAGALFYLGWAILNKPGVQVVSS